MSTNAIRGFTWPFKLVNGSVSMSSDETHVTQALMQIIGTDHNEMIAQPEFGCNIHRRVFDPVNTLPLARTDIKEAVTGEDLPIDSITVFEDDSKGYIGIGLILVEFSMAGNVYRLQFDLKQFDIVAQGSELAKSYPPTDPTLISHPVPAAQ